MSGLIYAQLTQCLLAGHPHSDVCAVLAPAQQAGLPHHLEGGRRAVLVRPEGGRWATAGLAVPLPVPKEWL